MQGNRYRTAKFMIMSRRKGGKETSQENRKEGMKERPKDRQIYMQDF